MISSPSADDLNPLHLVGRLGAEQRVECGLFGRVLRHGLLQLGRDLLTLAGVHRYRQLGPLS